MEHDVDRTYNDTVVVRGDTYGIFLYTWLDSGERVMWEVNIPGIKSRSCGYSYEEAKNNAKKAIENYLENFQQNRKNIHWTEKSTSDFQYFVSSDFAEQLIRIMDSKNVTRFELADRLGVPESTVSQVLDSPDDIPIDRMIEWSKAVGAKISVVVYDSSNEPMCGAVFNKCWESSGYPNATPSEGNDK